MQNWVLISGDRSQGKKIAAEKNIPIFAASLIALKLAEEGFDVDEFIAEVGEISDPFIIRDMDKAVKRVERAINSGERICVYGDYDADGVCSTAILYSYLRSRGADVMYYIPNRFTEGYGMNAKAVNRIGELDVQLIITVDNGISAYKEVQLATELGMDTVVVDHHTVPEKMPEAAAVVDPHRADDKSKFRDYCGAGLAFKLVMALEGDNSTVDELLDLYGAYAAIATVADVVSLTHENRTIVKRGLRRINNNSCLGVTSLREKSGLMAKDVTSENIGFGLGPRLNAAGRLGSASRAVQLLISEDKEEADRIASELCEENDNRKSTKEGITKAAVEYLNTHDNVRNRRVIVVAGEDWHEGVIGLVASDLREIYGKPTVVLSICGDVTKGSARSVEGYPMDKAVDSCKDLLRVYGGHPMAAGMSLNTENIDAFRDGLNDFAETLDDEFFSELRITARLNPGMMTLEQVRSLSLLEPFGEDNESPLFAYGGVTITGIYPISEGKYLNIYYTKDDKRFKSVCFSWSYNDFPYQVGDVIDIAVVLAENHYNGQTTVQARAVDIKITGVNNLNLMRSRRIYEDYSAGRPLTDKMRSELQTNREGFVKLYKYLAKNSGKNFLPEMIYYRLEEPQFTFGAMLLMIEAMEQLKLISCEHSREMINITVLPVTEKKDLFSAAIMQRIKAEN